MSTEEWNPSLDYYLKALEYLNDAVRLEAKRGLSKLEKQGLIQSFELTHELALTLLKAYNNRHNRSRSSDETTREAEYMGLIPKGRGWMKMLKSRKDALHSYDWDTAEELSEHICEIYQPLFNELGEKMRDLRTGQQTGLF